MNNLNYISLARKTAEGIHDFLRNDIRLPDQHKATFIAGCLIALNNDDFRNTYKHLTNAQMLMDNFNSAIQISIENFKGIDDAKSKEQILSNFVFISNTPTFTETIQNIDGTPTCFLQKLLELIEENIYSIAKANNAIDVLGEFYNEFTKYSTSDQQSLGIVLTPDHIANFMSDLLNIREDDIIFDPCCGTSSLLLTAASRGCKKVLGVECDSRMMAITVANMIIKDINCKLWLGDSWDKNILEQVQAESPTKTIMNPPYSVKGYPELGFLTNSLNVLVKNGLGVIILMTSCVGTGDNATILLKDNILKNHSLLATVSLNDEIFKPAVSVRTSILLLKAHNPNVESTQLLRLNDDGFVSVKNQGRQDIYNRWAGIKEDIYDLFLNHIELNGKSMNILLTATDSWIIENHIKHDGSLICEEKFALKLEEYYNYLNPKPAYTSDRRINNLQWKDFKYTDLFTIKRGNGPQSNDAEATPGLVPFVAAANNNNGVRFLTSYEPIFEGNVISVGNAGNGACGIAYYQPYPFTAGATATILIPKFTLTPAIGIFIATIITQEHDTHGHGNSLSNNVLKTLTLSLPVDENGDIAFEAIEEYIKQLPKAECLS